MKIKRLGMLLFTLFTSVLLSSKTPVNTSAEDMFQLATKTAKGAELVYENNQGSTDFAYISANKELVPLGSIPDPYTIIGFDTKGISDITGIGFRIRYRKESFIDLIRNTIQIGFGGDRTHGESVEQDYWVSASKIYDLGLSSRGVGVHQYGIWKLPAIGKVSDLLNIENDYWINATKYYYYNGNGTVPIHPKLGSYSYKFPKNDNLLNDPSKSFTKREYYAIIPFNWTDQISPESIDYYNIEGEFISSGTDNGKPFKDTDSGLYYIDTVLTEDFGVAINGKNAVLKKIQVSNFPSSTLLKVLVENASFDYEKQMTTQPYNRTQFIGNTILETNWSITNQNRYVFLKFAGEVEDAKQVKIRFYYTNDNEKASWIFRVKGEKGFLPPGYDTTMPTKPTIWDQIQKFLSIAFVVVILYFVVKLLILIFKLISTGRSAFGRRR